MRNRLQLKAMLSIAGIIAIVSIIGFSFPSCDQGDPEEIKVIDSKLIGKWEVESFDYEGTIYNSPFSGLGLNTAGYEYTSNGWTYYTDGNITQQISGAYTKGDLFYESIGTPFTGNLKWQIDGNTLTLTRDRIGNIAARTIVCKKAAKFSWENGNNNAGSYNIGDIGPGGGKIFYKNTAGFTVYQNANDSIGIKCNYLEAAPDNQGLHEWWAPGTWIIFGISGTETAIGTGKKNTAIILAADADASAAKACKEFSNNGKNDWFLPSKDELLELYKQRTIVDILSGAFWSSSQDSNPNAWFQVFTDGRQDHASKGSAIYVRAIRAF
jgi:hypothetical protein